MKISVYCSVGNEKRPFSRLLEQVAVAEEFLKSSFGSSAQLLFIVQHGHTPPIEVDWKFCQFLSYQAHVEQLESADIVLGHAGAGLLTDAINAGKRPFLLPRKESLREHLNDHQEQIFSFGVDQKLCYGFDTLCSNETITALASTETDFLSQTKHLSYSELSNLVLDRINIFGQS